MSGQHRHRLAHLAALFAALLGCALAPTARAKEARFVWGINGHPLVSYPGVGIDEQLNLVADLGLTSYRVDVTNVNQSDRLGQLIEKGQHLGIDILPVLIPPGSLDKDAPEALYKSAYDFAVHFVTRFKDSVKVWELGNELENYAMLQPCEIQDDGRQYNCSWGTASGVGKLEYHGGRWRKVSSVLKGLSEGTMSVTPDAIKAMGTAGWGHVGAFERMRDDGIKWDISVWHNYDGKHEWGLERVAKFGKPIWITEFNFSGGSQKGDVRQATGIATSAYEIHRLSQRYNVTGAHIYELLDETYWAPNYEAYMGLVYLEKAKGKSWRAAGPKPAYCSIRTMLRNGYRMRAGRSIIGKGDSTKAAPQQRTSSTPLSDKTVPKRSCDLCAFEARNVTLEEAISYTYCLALGHPHDGGGLIAWSRDVRSGKVKFENIRKTMVGLNLQRIKASTSLGDSAYVAYLRRLLLDSEPEGLEHWWLVRDLERGKINREQVIDRILASDRFRWMHPTLFHVKDPAVGTN
ncbi:MAG: hypothetical protein R3D67_17530 [Hyphomicrobiaceae bacterium]